MKLDKEKLKDIFLKTKDILSCLILVIIFFGIIFLLVKILIEYLGVPPWLLTGISLLLTLILTYFSRNLSMNYSLSMRDREFTTQSSEVLKKSRYKEQLRDEIVKGLLVEDDNSRKKTLEIAAKLNELNSEDWKYIEETIERSKVEVSLKKLEKAENYNIINKSNFEFKRFTNIQLPNSCLLDKKVILSVQLTQKIEETSRKAIPLNLSAKPDQSQLILEIHINSLAFAIHEYRKNLTVPVLGDSEKITFTLFPVQLGEQVVEIEFFHEGSRIGYVLVTTIVNEDSDQFETSFVTTKETLQVQTLYQNNSRAPQSFILENPSNKIPHLLTKTTQKDKKTLHVDLKDGIITYSLYATGIVDHGDWKSQITNLNQYIDGALKDLNELLEDIAKRGNPSDEDWESINFNLKAKGKNLFKKLIPIQLAEQISNWEPGTCVLIATNEQWIPWELLHDENDFFGRKFILARLPRLADKKDLPKTPRPEFMTNNNSNFAVINVVGGGLGKLRENAEKLFEDFSKSSLVIKTLQEQPITSLQKEVLDANILHLTCHGHLNPHLLQIAKNSSPGLNLLPDSVQELDFLPGILVFANACSSAAPVLYFGQFSNFGWQFYCRGAGAFVGTIGVIPTEYAILFAKTFYEKLLQSDSVGASEQNKRRTVGECMALSKEAASEKKNLFWLFYCLYGDPDFSLNN